MEDVACLKTWNKFEYERSWFLLISERALVFNKVDLRYVKNIIFFSLPESLEVTSKLLKLLNQESGLQIKEIMEKREKRKQERIQEIIKDKGRKIYKTKREEKQEKRIIEDE